MQYNRLAAWRKSCLASKKICFPLVASKRKGARQRMEARAFDVAPGFARGHAGQAGTNQRHASFQVCWSTKARLPVRTPDQSSAGHSQFLILHWVLVAGIERPIFRDKSHQGRLRSPLVGLLAHALRIQTTLGTTGLGSRADGNDTRILGTARLTRKPNRHNGKQNVLFCC